MSRWTQGTVIRHKEWTQGLYSLYVKADILPFVAGQFTQIGVGQETPKIFRPYSFANAPDEPALEFYYNLVQGGEFTPLIADLKPGSPLWVATKPSGRFMLSEVPAAHTLWLIATGTGLGPFLSILKTASAWERYQHIVLVHSVRKANSLTHQDLIELLHHKYPEKFKWVPVVTGEKNPGMQFERVTTLLKQDQFESLTGLTITPSTSQVMLCGNPQMVSDVTTILEQRGLMLNKMRHPGHITIENYWKLEDE
jgi:ferredoxin--NADP+ reductase